MAHRVIKNWSVFWNQRFLNKIVTKKRGFVCHDVPAGQADFVSYTEQQRDSLATFTQFSVLFEIQHEFRGRYFGNFDRVQIDSGRRRSNLVLPLFSPTGRFLLRRIKARTIFPWSSIKFHFNKFFCLYFTWLFSVFFKHSIAFDLK